MNLLENQEQMQIFGCWFLHLYIAPEEIYKKRLKKEQTFDYQVETRHHLPISRGPFIIIQMYIIQYIICALTLDAQRFEACG